MKNATKYQKKVKKLLAAMDKSVEVPDGADAIQVLLRAVLEANASAKHAQTALAAIDEEFVDINELRVSPPKEIADILGKDYPEARRKAREIATVLNGVYSRVSKLCLEHVEKLTKRDLRRHLQELGLSLYASACVVLEAFGGHAIPVDETLVECLEMKGCVHPGSDVTEVQGFLERIILQKHAPAAHRFFRTLIEKSAPALARKRKAEAKARAKAEAEARAKAEAEAKAKAEAEAKAKAAAKAKARAAAKAKAAKKAKERARKAKAATGARKAARKATRKAGAKASTKAAGAKKRKPAAKKTKKKKAPGAARKSR